MKPFGHKYCDYVKLSLMIKEVDKLSMKLTCILLAPFDESMNRIKDAIEVTLRSENIELLRMDKSLSPGAQWANSSLNLIRSVDFIIADITRYNPNVLYEMGYAQALNKPILMIIDKSSAKSIPTYLAGFLYLAYDNNNLRELTLNISMYVKRIKKGRND